MRNNAKHVWVFRHRKECVAVSKIPIGFGPQTRHAAAAALYPFMLCAETLNDLQMYSTYLLII